MRQNKWCTMDSCDMQIYMSLSWNVNTRASPHVDISTSGHIYFSMSHSPSCNICILLLSYQQMHYNWTHTNAELVWYRKLQATLFTVKIQDYCIASSETSLGFSSIKAFLHDFAGLEVLSFKFNNFAAFLRTPPNNEYNRKSQTERFNVCINNNPVEQEDGARKYQPERMNEQHWNGSHTFGRFIEQLYDNSDMSADCQ